MESRLRGSTSEREKPMSRWIRPRKAAIPGIALLVVLAAVLAFTRGAGAAGASQTYLVLYNQQAVPSDASTSIAAAGGTLQYAYGQIGVAIATSSSASFATDVQKDTRVAGAS